MATLGTFAARWAFRALLGQAMPAGIRELHGRVWPAGNVTLLTLVHPAVGQQCTDGYCGGGVAWVALPLGVHHRNPRLPPPPLLRELLLRLLELDRLLELRLLLELKLLREEPPL